MLSRIIGGILLIVGTSIGGGMLALPVANAGIGFGLSSILLVFCWALMALGAFFILEANLYLPPGKHMVSMAQSTLGPAGLLVAWLSYLFLLYTLLAAYISGGADVFGALLSQCHIPSGDWQNSLLFTLLFGSIVAGGIKPVDWFNRFLMFGKLGIYLALVIFIAPHIELNHLKATPNPAITISTLMILITSFGFAIIVPNLRDYFNDNIVILKKVIIIGSLIPLVCYLAWDAVIIGSLPYEGNEALTTLMHHSHPTSMLEQILTKTIHNSFISSLFNTFSSICMLTAFLGVSLCLTSFLSDGLKMENQGFSSLVLFLLTFSPPLILVIYAPGIYINALSYAGFFCVILLLLLPACMSLCGRKKFKAPFIVPGGCYTQYGVIACSIVLMTTTLWEILT